jgi:hypothetical protein
MTLPKSVLTLCVLSCCAVASAQDVFVYRPNFAVPPPIYYDLGPPVAMDRFVHRENYAAKRHRIPGRVPSYDEYYFRKHGELPRYEQPTSDYRHYWR